MIISSRFTLNSISRRLNRFVQKLHRHNILILDVKLIYRYQITVKGTLAKPLMFLRIILNVKISYPYLSLVAQSRLYSPQQA